MSKAHEQELARVHRDVARVAGGLSLVLIRRRVSPNAVKGWAAALRAAADRLEQLV
jgi:DNA-binding IclR family transcriptional regulator